MCNIYKVCFIRKMESLTEALYFSMLLIGIGSFICGILPVIFSFRMTRSHPFFLSLMLCLGAGVLLATSLVHMLTDVQTKLKLSAQLYFCAGFLTLYTFDEVTHCCVPSRKLEIHSIVAEREGSAHRQRNYGSACPTENSPFLESSNKNAGVLPHERHFECSPSHFSGICNREKSKAESQQDLSSACSHSENNADDQIVPASETKWSPNPAVQTGLYIALLIHSILEGVSIGVQTNISQVLLILGAVTFHKILLSFCLGLELYQQRFKILNLVVTIFTFSIGSPIGILIGMKAASLEKNFFDIDAQLQAVAAGSLLYVAAFEVLPRERFKWQESRSQKAAGIFQLVSVLLGFFCITVFHFFMGSECQNMISAATQRVIALVDMDCFYCQVEARLNPSLKQKPLAVVQYNQWKGGGIIAVNYEARDRGVTRYMRGDEAKEICPEIILVSVPTIRGKADLSKDAGDEVAQVFSEFSECVQRASIDEAYLDLTKAVQEWIKNECEEISVNDLPNSFVVGYCDLKNKNEDDRKKGLAVWLKHVEREKTRESADYHLAVGAKIVEKMRSEVLKRTGFHCSAGIAHNKILAKLTAGLHKPNKQTILPQDSVPELYENLPIYKVRNLGGKLGKQVEEKLSIKFMSELYNFSLVELQQKFDEKTSNWLYNIARGIDLDPVTSRLRPESIGCCKNFTGKNALKTRSEVEHWLKELATEISERLQKDMERNKRRAKLLTVSFSQETSMTRCGALHSYEVGRIVSEALELLKKFNNASASEDAWIPPVKFLGLAASKFTDETSSKIEKYLKNNKNSESIKLLDFPSCSKSLAEADLEKESKKPTGECSNFFKNVEKSKDADNNTNNEPMKSFFLEFLNNKKVSYPLEEEIDIFEETEKEPEEKKQENKKEEEKEKETWISLSEVFPDINQAEKEVVESLPEALKEKLEERLNSANGDAGNLPQNGIKLTKICSECGKNILVSEFSIHSDYHAALKLYTEINKPANNSVSGGTKKSKSKDAEGTKRKKKGPVTPPKKMKSLTSFFAPLAKK